MLDGNDPCPVTGRGSFGSMLRKTAFLLWVTSLALPLWATAFPPPPFRSWGFTAYYMPEPVFLHDAEGFTAEATLKVSRRLTLSGGRPLLLSTLVFYEDHGQDNLDPRSAAKLNLTPDGKVNVQVWEGKFFCGLSLGSEVFFVLFFSIHGF